VAGLVIIFTAFLVIRGWSIAPETEVEVRYNYTVDVGRIIGWTLAGIGVASAGVAYALKLLHEIKKPEDREEE
jgi:hypothetical protein